jgi:hypothetical protein
MCYFKSSLFQPLCQRFRTGLQFFHTFLGRLGALHFRVHRDVHTSGVIFISSAKYEVLATLAVKILSPGMSPFSLADR